MRCPKCGHHWKTMPGEEQDHGCPRCSDNPAPDEPAECGGLCGLCGLPGADKIPHPVHWPGERAPETELVHAECEQEECGRAHAELSDKEREAFLRTII